MTGPSILVLDTESSSAATRSLLTILEESISLRGCSRRILGARDIGECVGNDAERYLTDFGPDLVLLSLSPSANTIAAEVVSRVRAHSPTLPIIVLGTTEDPDVMFAF